VAVAADGSTPFNLPLQLVLGKMPQKEVRVCMCMYVSVCVCKCICMHPPTTSAKEDAAEGSTSICMWMYIRVYVSKIVYLFMNVYFFVSRRFCL
jgi:hypothetical protein